MGLLNNKSISIDFGNKFLKFAIGEYKNNQLTIDQLFSKEIDEGLLNNGRISDENGIRDLIHNAIKEKKIKAKNISFTLESSNIIKREVIIPIVDKNDESSLIEFEMEQYLPDPISEYIIQSKELDIIHINNEDKKRLLVAAMPQNMADSYYQLAIDLKLKPTSFDIHSNVISKLMKFNNLNSPGETFENHSNLAIDIGHNFIDIFILENEKYKFGRRIFSGIQELIKLRSINEDNIKDNDFRNILVEKNITVLQEIDYWIDEIRKIIKYFEDLYEENKIERVYLYGYGALIKGIDESFNTRLGLNTKILEVNTGINLNDEIILDDLPTYMNAIGILIDE